METERPSSKSFFFQPTPKTTLNCVCPDLISLLLSFSSTPLDLTPTHHPQANKSIYVN